MYNKMRLYDLSFAPPNQKKGVNPQIIFTLHIAHLGELNKRLIRIIFWTDVRAYLGEEKPFHYPTLDLFGHGEFGFGRCGILTREGDNVQLRLELLESRLYYVTLTINVLSAALRVPIEDGVYLSNQRQQLDLETLCEMNRSQGYGHAVGGYVSIEVISWLKARGEKAGKDDYYVQMPEPVLEAMRDAWRAVSSKNNGKWVTECQARISTDGRFILECAGNACDIAIYPDDFHYSVDHGSRFGCHNLDNANQQVTLIAGLAKLCELARGDE